MIRSIHAIFDGKAFVPQEPIDLPANQRVTLTVESSGTVVEKGEPYSFLKIAAEVAIEGPMDWSSRFHDHLYGTHDGR